jgi:hypothetical protein
MVVECRRELKLLVVSSPFSLLKIEFDRIEGWRQGRLSLIRRGGLMTHYRHVLRVSSSRSIQPIEAWLSRNCRAEWAIRFEGISDDLISKNWQISFADVNDLAAFRRVVRMRGMPDRPDVRPAAAIDKKDKGGRSLR